MSAKASKKQLRFAKKKSVEQVVDGLLTEEFNPLPQQTSAIKFLVSRAVAGLLLDPGLGKTMCVYSAFDLIRQKTAMDLLVVVAPLRPTRLVWPKEAIKWRTGLKVGVLRGKHRDEILHDGSYDTLVINYESLPWLFEQVASNKNLRTRFKTAMLVLDESTKIKNSRSQRFKILKQMFGMFMRRVILTGTPSPNGFMDLWAQIYALDMGGALGRFITHYRRQFFSPSGYMGYDWVLNEGADEEIYARLRPLVLRIERKDIKGMPRLKTVDIPVELPDDARKKYDSMYGDLVSQVGRHEVTAKNAAVATMKCRQICSGALYTDKGRRNVLHIHDAKIEALADLIDELNGKPVLVAVEFQHEVERIRKALGKNIPALVGGLSEKEADKIVDRWNRGEIPVLLGNPQSIAHGLNLQGAASNVIWFTVPWNLEWYLQFIARLLRTGQKAKFVMNYRLVVQDTVDQIAASVIDRKDASQNDLLRALAAEIKQRRKAA